MDPRKRLGHRLLAGAAVALLVVLGGVSCNMGVPDYRLTVTLSEGVTGSPPTGEYVYKELSQVSFSYAGVDPLQTIEVFLNGRFRYEGTGSIIMYGTGYVLTARKIDLRGDWDVKMTQVAPSVTPAVTYAFTLTLAGASELGGVFADSRGYHGTWKAESGILLLTFTDWADFALSGSVYGTVGTYAGAGTTGTWSATKKLTGAAASAIRSGG